MNNILEISHLSKNYITETGTIPAIKDITLSIRSGEIVTLVGTSGCGKSTLLSILAGIDKETDGFYTIRSEQPVIGYMLQTDSLFPWLTIYENAILGLKIQKKDTKALSFALIYSFQRLFYQKKEVNSRNLHSLCQIYLLTIFHFSHMYNHYFLILVQ